MSRREETRRGTRIPAGSLLIIESDSRLSDKLASDFRRRGYTVECTDNLLRVQTYDLARVDFAIVDLWLRNGSGLDVIAEIKRRAPEIRIVVLTSHGSIATAVQATKLGADQYLTKPVDSDAIERILLAD